MVITYRMTTCVLYTRVLVVRRRWYPRTVNGYGGVDVVRTERETHGRTDRTVVLNV